MDFLKGWKYKYSKRERCIQAKSHDEVGRIVKMVAKVLHNAAEKKPAAAAAMHSSFSRLFFWQHASLLLSQVLSGDDAIHFQPNLHLVSAIHVFFGIFIWHVYIVAICAAL